MRLWTYALLFAALLLTFDDARGAPASPRPLQTWDALPAFDPLHLAGAYRGQRVCPMCTHGYDAGLVLFLPSDGNPVDAAAAIAPMRRVRAQIDSPRFRVFVILVGATPTAELLDAVGHAHPQWYVAQLDGDERTAAEHDFGLALGDAPIGYVFAQRRLLRRYERSALLDPASTLAHDAGYAMQLLDWLHPMPLPADAEHDRPQGELWLAPSRLNEALQLADAVPEPACFQGDDGAALAQALLIVNEAASAPPRPHWARTNSQGCVALAADPGRYRVTLYPLGEARMTRELLRVDPTDQPPVLGACQGCEAVYDGRPLHIASRTALAAGDEPGERLHLRGRVLGTHGKPVAGVQVYAYQTDHAGHYPPLDGAGPAAQRHGRLRGWAISDTQGRYHFDSIRPGHYPGRRVPQHIHLHVIEPGRCTYFLDNVVFADDPYLADEPPSEQPRGGSGLTRPERSADGSWEVQRDIHLGRHVSDYDECGSGDR